jgi:hypothetical protein
MNKVALYFLLILAYLAISNSFNPDKLGFIYITEPKEIESIVNKYPVSVILTDIQTKGVFLKSYYLKFKIVYGFSNHRETIVRTDESFATSNKAFIGMSLFRINSNGESSLLPLPPGSVFVGNRQFGKWKYKKSKSEWAFYRFYKHFPNVLGWGSFRPTKKFYKEIQKFLNQNVNFFGENNEFGTNGSITKKVYNLNFKKSNNYNNLSENIKLQLLKFNFGSPQIKQE